MVASFVNMLSLARPSKKPNPSPRRQVVGFNERVIVSREFKEHFFNYWTKFSEFIDNWQQSPYRSEGFLGINRFALGGGDEREDRKGGFWINIEIIGIHKYAFLVDNCF